LTFRYINLSFNYFGNFYRIIDAYLVSENLRNFRQSKDSIVVLTRIAWAAIVTSAHRLSQGLHLGRA